MNKKEMAFCFAVSFVILFSLSFVLGEVRINEVMYNPECSNDNCEYLEIYSSSIINITLIDKYGTSNRTTNISVYEGYNLITKNLVSFLENWDNSTNITEWGSLSLSNTADDIWIYNDTNLLDYFNYTSSLGADGNGKSLQYCSGNWTENTPTPGAVNNCTAESQTQTCTPSLTCSNSSCTNGYITQTCINTSSTCINSTITQNISCSTSSTTNSDISLNLTWTNGEIINGNNFSIEVKAFNLQNLSYDLKVWLEFKDNNTIISDRYDETDEEWKSGTYFIIGFFSGGGNKTKDINLHLREDYLNFSGEAKIFAKLREDSDTISEVNYTINVLEKTESGSDNILITATETTNNTNSTNNETGIIKLGSKTSKKINPAEDIKTENSIVYKSKNEYIKEYAIYGFAVLCVFLIILLLIDKK